MGVLISFSKYKAKMNQARFYWRMTLCSYQDLARHSGITAERAQRWQLVFLKEKKKEEVNNGK